MLVVLLRHGIAVDRDDPDCPPDSERPLTARGRRRTRAAAQGLAALGVAPDRILCSRYRRARETAEIASQELGTKRVDAVDGLLPDDSPGQLGPLLRQHRGAETLLLVGHAPHLDRALAWLLDGGARPLTALKKAGAAAIDLRDPGEPGGTLSWLCTPSMLRTLRAG